MAGFKKIDSKKIGSANLPHTYQLDDRLKEMIIYGKNIVGCSDRAVYNLFFLCFLVNCFIIIIALLIFLL